MQENAAVSPDAVDVMLIQKGKTKLLNGMGLIVALWYNINIFAMEGT